MSTNPANHQNKSAENNSSSPRSSGTAVHHAPSATPLNGNPDDIRIVLSRNSNRPSEGNKSPAWQIVHNRKRPRYSNSDTEEENNLIPCNNNRYTALSDTNGINDNDMNVDDTNTNEGRERTPKPPPIFIPGVGSITALTTCLDKDINRSDYTHKTIDANGQIKIIAKDSDTFRKIIHILNGENAAYHTYQLKENRAYRVVIRSLHPTTPTDEIKKAIEELGHQVRNVMNVKHGKTKQSLPLFFVDLEPKPNNKDIYDVNALLNAKIEVEPPRKKSMIAQCTRCQRYGHTKSYCRRQYRCVKCGGEHNTTSCGKSSDTPAKCVLCEGDHPASYKGCRVYQSILEKRNSSAQKPHWLRSRPRQGAQQTDEQPNQQSTTEQTWETRPARSYAQAATARPGNNENTSNDNATIINILENSFNEFRSALTQQNELLKTMLNLLTAVLTKFTNK